jgi:hypothetical protein
MLSIGRTRPERTASLTSGRGMSARIEASRKCSPSARAISRTMASVFSRCGAAPAEPAVPIKSGMSSLRAARRSRLKSVRVVTGAVASSPLPR